MSGFIEGLNRSQSTLFPETLDDYIDEDNSVRVINAFVDEINLTKLGFVRTQPCQTGRPARALHPFGLARKKVFRKIYAGPARWIAADSHNASEAAMRLRPPAGFPFESSI